MAGTARRVCGVLLMLGLVLGVVGSFATPAAATTHNTEPICNNQQGNDKGPDDCEGDKLHGEVTWSFEGNDLVFDIKSTNGFTAGWRQIYICIPGTERSNGADCQGNTETVLSPSGYDVSGATGIKENDKDVEFDCDTAFSARVAAKTLDDLKIDRSNFAWTIHVNTCNGGTDEAFGTVTSSENPPPSPVRTYACTGATVSGDDAVLKGSTDDPAVTAATFTLTSSSGSLPSIAGARNGQEFTAEVSDLANGTYTYTVAFTGTGVSKTSGSCQFTVAVIPATQTADISNPTITNTPGGVLNEAVVAGVQLTREPAQATLAATAPPATLAATGMSTTLVAAGGMLVGLGVLLTISSRAARRPGGAHYVA